MTAQLQLKRWASRLALLVVLLVGLGAFDFKASADTTITFDWSMEDRFTDVNGDGVLDESMDAAYLNPTSWNVKFDACSSPAGQNPPANSEFRWTITRAGSTNRTGTGCSYTASLDHLGPWTATVRLVDKTSGSVHSSANQSVTLADHFIVSLGDSIGSGEGNPDTVGNRTLGPFPFYEPIWADRECHRSTLAGSAQAARRLERRDPHSAVTFLHLACSGATVEVGLLGEYEGIEPDNSDGKEPPQLARAISLAAGRPIDALVISIGANNAKFSEIVATCIKFSNCHNFTGIPNQENAAQIFDRVKGDVDTALDKLDTELDKHTTAGKVRKVFLGEYFDPAFNDDGTVCKGSTFRERDSLVSPDVIEAGAPIVDGVSEAEWSWASGTVVKTINDKVKAATERAASDGGGSWTYIGGVAAEFKNHGYCAVDRWVRTLWESFTYQHNKDGAFHPNSEGHLMGLAKNYELTIGSALAVPGTPLPFDPDPAMAQSANGIAQYVQLLDQVNAFSTLANSLPFHAGSKINEGLQTLFDTLAQVQSTVANLSNETTQTLTKLDTRLDDLDNNGDTTSDVNIPGLKVDIDATIGPHLPALKYDVQLKLKVTVDNSNPSLAWLADGMQINGTPLDGQTLINSTVDFTLEPKLPDLSKRFRMPIRSGPLGSLGFAFQADLGGNSSTVGGDTNPVTFTAGIGEVSARGTMKAEVHADFSVVDPNNDGFLDATEMSPSTLFNVTCGSTGAQIDLQVKAALLGMENSIGSLKLDDPDLCDGVATPQVALGDLQGFRNVTAADILNGIAQLSTLLQTLQASGDLDIPFVADGLSKLVAINDKIVKFFVDNGLTDPNEPMKNINIPQDKRALFDTLNEIVAGLAAKLGVPVRPRWEGGRIVFPLDLSENPAPFTRSGQLDFDDQLARAGLTDLVNTSGGGTITVDPSYSLKVGLGVDLAPNLGLADRFFIQPNASEPEASISLDSPLTGDVAVSGKLAFVTATLADQNSTGPVPLLQPAVTGQPIAKLEINGGPDNRLTLAEAIASPNFPVTPSFNAVVPGTTLTAAVSVGGCDAGTGSLTFGWTNVPDPAGFSVAVNGAYKDCFLPLAFDLENPQAALTQLLSVIREAVVSVRELIGTDGESVQSLPLIGDSAAEIDPLLVKIQDKLDAIIAANQALTLDAAEAAAEEVLGAALGIAPEARGGLLDLTVEKAVTGTNPKPAALVATLDLGVCTDDRPSTACAVEVANPTAPLTLALGTTGDDTGLAGLDANGRAEMSFDATAHVVAGLELPTVAPGGPGALPSVSGSVVPFVRDDTRVDIGLGLTGAASFEANLGPVKIAIGKTGDLSKAELRARYVMVDPTITNERLAVGGTAFSNWLAAIAPSPAKGIHDTPRATCDLANTAVDACAKLPVYAGSDKLGEIVFKAPDLLAPSGWTFDGVDQVLNNINPSALTWSAIFEGLDALAERLEAALASIPPGQPVPLLGTDPTASAELVKKFRQGVLNPINALIQSLESAGGRTQLVSLTQDFFFERLGPNGTIAPLLRDRPNDTGNDVTKEDVVVDLFCVHTVNNTQVLELCSGTDPLSAVERYQVWLPLGLGGQASTPAFDLGFPGLRLASQSGVSASAGFNVDVRFGLDKDLGFYIPTVRPSAPTPTTATADGAEIQLFADASVPNVADGPDLQGDLVFLPVTIEDNHAGPDVKAGVNIDLAGGGGDGLLTLQQIDTVTVNPSVSACVNLDLHIELSAPKINNQLAPSAMPRLLTDFAAKGGYSCDGSIGAPMSGFTLGFNNVAVEPGKLFRDFITPAVTEVRKYTGPLEPLVKTLKTPIPGLDELSRKVGVEPPTWYSAFKQSQSLGGQPSASLELVDRMINFIELVETLGSVDPVTGTPAPIVIGSFTVPLAKVVEPVPQTSIASLVQGAPSDNRSVLDRLSGVAADVQRELSEARAQSGGVKFPVLDDPKMLFQVLVGKDVPLIYFDAGTLRAQKSFQASFNWGPAIVYIGGFAKVEGHLAAGFDTYGIRQAIAVLTDDDPDNDGFFSVLDGVIQGFYLDDYDLKGVDVPEIRFEAELTAGAGVGVPGLNVGIEGGINGRFDMNIKDQDGRLRFGEIVEQIKTRSPNPLCFFDASTRLTAFLRLAFNNPIKNWYEPIVDKVLYEDPDLDFCTVPPPPPAVLHPQDGTLELRTQSKPDVISVTFTAAGTAKVVTTESTGTFSGVNRVFGDVKGGRDIVVINAVSGVNARPAIICGGNGADDITVTNGASRLYGDGGGQHQVANGGPLLQCAASTSPGRDRLTGSIRNDTIYGGPQIDVIQGDAGDDTIRGEEHDDILLGGAGNDDIDGGAGDDHLVGGLGNDTIEGGTSGESSPGVKIPERDRVSYEDRTAGVTAQIPGTGGQAGETDTMAGVEILRGGDGPDVLTGPTTIEGIIEGGKGDDRITGGDRRDVIDGGPGDDILSGGLGGNQLYGREGDDRFLIGPGTDTMIGSEGTDTVDYSSLDGPVTVRVDNIQNDGTASFGLDNVVDLDVIFGTNAGDQLVGGSNAERLVGLAGDDRLDGGDNDDTLVAGDGNDGLEGGGGGDELSAGAGDDALSGGAGPDRLVAATGNDRLRGGDGEDNLQGGGGNDYLEGGNGGDTLDGASGVDTADYSGRLDAVAVDVTQPGCDGNAIDARSLLLPGPGCDLDDVRPTVEVVLGGHGGDTIRGDSSAEVLVGGPGNDTISGGGGGDRLDGGIGNDNLFDVAPNTFATDSSVDTMLGGAGDDGAVSHGGGDVVEGGTGNDTLVGGAGADSIRGGLGDDNIRAGGGADIDITGGDGNDTIEGGDGNDTLAGGPGDDTLFGQAGADTLEGADGADTLVGGGPSEDNTGDLGDVLRGGNGDDRLDGGAAADQLIGGAGNDRLEGGDANDTLEGGAGDDEERGEAGDDTFVQGSSANGADVLSGGDGSADRADYSARPSGSVVLSRNGVADDGATGERDNVLADVEQLARPA